MNDEISVSRISIQTSSSKHPCHFVTIERSTKNEGSAQIINIFFCCLLSPLFIIPHSSLPKFISCLQPTFRRTSRHCLRIVSATNFLYTLPTDPYTKANFLHIPPLILVQFILINLAPLATTLHSPLPLSLSQSLFRLQRI